MKRSESKYSISSGIGKIFFQWFLIISLVPLVAVSIVNYYSSKESLISDTTRHLSATLEFKKQYIEAFFNERLDGLELQSHLAENITFLTELCDLHHELGLPAKDFVRHERWLELTSKHETDLRRLKELYGYHDVLLINIKGDIFFTVAGEDKIGTNIFTGEHKNTLFSRACLKAIETGEAVFSDMETYDDEAHKVDSFFVHALINRQGEKIGLLAFDITLEKIDRLMQDRTGMGQTGETFLVGSDQLMRSDSWKEAGGTALETRIETKLIKNWLASKETEKDNPPVSSQPSYAVLDYINHRGTRVFGVINDLKSLESYGIHWALIAEVTEAEALALVKRLRLIVWSLLIGTTAVVTLISVLVTREIVTPIRKLSKWTGQVAQGNLSTIEDRPPENEIGELHSSFNQMVKSFQEVTKVCESVSLGDFTKTVTLRSENDTLGQAVNQMAENLRVAVRQAEVVSAGDFSVQITPWSDEDKLGNALLRMTLKLREMMEINQKALADASRLAEYVNNLPTPVLSIDRNFRIVYANYAAASLTGLDQTDCIGKRCYELFRNAHCQTDDCRVGQAMRNKRVETAETVIDLDGINMPIRYTGAPILDEKGDVIGALEYIIDISKLREIMEINQRSLAEASRLAEYLNNLPTPVISVDLNFQIIYSNKAAAAFAGLQHTECLGRKCYDLYRNPHCETRDCRIAQAIRKKSIETAETIIDPDGANIPVRYTGAPVLDKNGEVIGALEYIVDITETKNAFNIIEKENWLQAGIAAANDRLRGEQEIKQLCNNLLSGLADRLDIQAAAMYVTDNHTLQLCGTYSTTGGNTCRESFAIGEGVIGQAAYEKKRIIVKDVPKESIHLVSSLVEAVPQQLVALPLLYENQVKGVIELGSFVAFTSDELELLDRLAGNIAIAINSVQSRTQLAELLGETQRQSEELQTQQEELQSTNEELQTQTQSLKERESQLQSQHEELMVLNEELEEKTNSLEKQKNDIQEKNTALKEASRNIEKKAEELAIASKYKSEFLANMSHELRTPLNSLLLLSHNLSKNKEGNLTDDQVESANVMYSSGNDLLELINEILDLSKIEAGRVDLGLEDVSLKDFADRMQSHFMPVMAEKGLDLSFVITPKAPKTISTDRQRLEQIVRNLISNAAKFTEKGGITVSLRRVTGEDHLQKSDLAPDNTLAIAVTDTGIGISPAKQKIIFEAFQQADGSTSRKYGGTGLGLSISRELAELLGGEIQLTSVPGSGSTFTLYLPFTSSAPNGQPKRPAKQKVKTTSAIRKRRKQPPIQDDRESITEGDKTILIVEDDLNFAKSLIKQSHDEGFKCLTSPNGQDGLGLAEEYKPNAIILDINLPEMNGWEVLDALKKNPALRHIPVHMMSVEEKTLDAYKKGAVGYLHKPVTQEDLHRAFNRLDKVIASDLRELLVVEDDLVLRQEIVKLIGNGDVRATAVATGAEVITILSDMKFDCMILDIGLPDMTGFELLDRLEKEEDIEIPPVIVYTGRELTKEENDSLYHYTDSIIIKGVKSIERLLDETALFLHRVVAKMPDEKRKMIANLYEQDAMFRGKKILIVDDDMRNAFALSKILSDKEMKTFIANTGQKALETLEKEKDIDLVLMDIMMPEMDGYEAMQKIRAQKKFWNLPLIALTAKAMPEDKGKCMKAGASDYLAKPVEVERLLSMMRIWLYR